MAGEPVPQKAVQLVERWPGLLRRDEVPGQAPIAGDILPDEDDGLTDAWMRPEHGLQLAQLDPKPPDLHLVIQPPQEFDVAIRPITGAVPGLVEARAGLLAEWIRNELFGGLFRPAPIPPGHAVAPDIQLAGHPDR